MSELPEAFRRFRSKYPAVVSAHERLGVACSEGGPLDAKTRELVRLGIAIGGRLEGGAHSHVRRALDAGASAAEIRHVVVLAAPTVGFSTAIAAFTWVEDLLGKD